MNRPPDPEQVASPESGESRRERRVRETRRKILRAALDLFEDRGIDNVTVEEIADRADVARGTIFNYFASKESLCLEMGELQLEMLREAAESGRIPGPKATEKIAQALRLLGEFPGRNPATCRDLLTRALCSMKPGELPQHRVELFEMFEEWVAEGQRRGELRQDLRPHEIACFLLGLQFHGNLLWAYGFVADSLADYLERTLQIALGGLRGAPNPDDAT